MYGSISQPGLQRMQRCLTELEMDPLKPKKQFESRNAIRLHARDSVTYYFGPSVPFRQVAEQAAMNTHKILKINARGTARKCRGDFVCR